MSEILEYLVVPQGYYCKPQLSLNGMNKGILFILVFFFFG